MTEDTLSFEQLEAEPGMPALEFELWNVRWEGLYLGQLAYMPTRKGNDGGHDWVAMLRWRDPARDSAHSRQARTEYHADRRGAVDAFLDFYNAGTVHGEAGS